MKQRGAVTHTSQGQRDATLPTADRLRNAAPCCQRPVTGLDPKDPIQPPTHHPTHTRERPSKTCARMLTRASSRREIARIQETCPSPKGCGQRTAKHHLQPESTTIAIDGRLRRRALATVGPRLTHDLRRSFESPLPTNRGQQDPSRRPATAPPRWATAPFARTPSSLRGT